MIWHLLQIKASTNPLCDKEAMLVDKAITKYGMGWAVLMNKLWEGILLCMTVSKTIQYITAVVYAKREDILKLGWLPKRKRGEFSLLKLVHRALYVHNWHLYLRIQVT